VGKLCHATTADADGFGMGFATRAIHSLGLHRVPHLLVAHDGLDEFGATFRDYFPGAVHQVDHFHVDERLWEASGANLRRFRWLKARAFADPLRLARGIRQGRIRDCHGDLHMKNICLADKVYIYDCIEFNPRFRYGDVAADVDFLAMDLDFYGWRELSRYFVARLAQAAEDPELLQLLDFYKCYRAYVGGKVAALSAQDPELAPQARGQAEQQARAYFALAGEYAEAGACWCAS